MRLPSTSPYILSPADVVGQGEALEWRDVETRPSRHADTVLVEAKSSVSESCAYTDRARRGDAAAAAGRQKFYWIQVRKKWFWPLIREMASNPGRLDRDGGGPK